MGKKPKGLNGEMTLSYSYGVKAFLFGLLLD